MLTQVLQGQTVWVGPFSQGLLLKRSFHNGTRVVASFGVQTIIDQVTKSMEGDCYLCVPGEATPGWWVAFKATWLWHPSVVNRGPTPLGSLGSGVETLSSKVQDRHGLESWLCDGTWENDKTLLSVLIPKWGNKNPFHGTALKTAQGHSCEG